MQNIYRHLLPGLALAALLGLSGCEREGPAERVGQKVDDAVEEARDTLDDASDEVEDAAEQAQDTASDASDEIVEELHQH